MTARPVTYFCAEFGIHESIPLYSGGLGILAGDHLKSASDLGISMIGVSIFYREGYFRQRISKTGEQIVNYELFNPEDFSLVRVTDKEGQPLTIDLPIQGENVSIGAWTVDLGKVPLYFLDIESAVHKIGIQELGLRLYGGDESVRLSQIETKKAKKVKIWTLRYTKPKIYWRYKIKREISGYQTPLISPY